MNIVPRSKRRVSQDILDKFVIKNSDLKDCNGFESAFSVVRPLAIDVGCGNGDFLYPYALSRPDMNVLGIEIQWKRICKASRKLFQHKVSNSRLICGDFRDILADNMRPGSARIFWFNFPDPWTKRKHHDRRLMDGVTVRLLERMLEPGGAVVFVTDVKELADEAGFFLNGCTCLVNSYAPALYAPDMPGYVQSYYYRKWKSEGCRFYFLMYKKPMVD